MANFMDKVKNNETETLEVSGSTDSSKVNIENWMRRLIEVYKKMNGNYICDGNCSIVKGNGGVLLGKIGNVYFKSTSNLLKSTISFYEEPEFNYDFKYHSGSMHDDVYDYWYTTRVSTVRLRPKGKLVIDSVEYDRTSIGMLVSDPKPSNMLSYGIYETSSYAKIEDEFDYACKQIRGR